MLISIFSIISGIFIGVFVLTESRMFGEDTKVNALTALGAGGVSAIVIAFSPRVPALVAVLLFLPLAMAVLAYGIYWWIQNGSTGKELAFYIVIVFILTMVADSPAARVLDLNWPRFLKGLVRALPGVAFWMSIGLAIANKIWFREELKRMDSEEFEESDDSEESDEYDSEDFDPDEYARDFMKRMARG